MLRSRHLAPLFGLALLCGACADDDTSPLPDGGGADKGVADGAADSTMKDDGAADTMAADTMAADTMAADLKVCAAGNDAGQMLGGVKGNVKIGSGITCGSTGDDDCKGAIAIVVLDKPLPPPLSNVLGAQFLDSADLSAGKTVAYEIQGIEQTGAVVYLSAYMDEDQTAITPPPAGPVAGDPAVVGVISTTIVCDDTQSVDVELNERYAPAPDGGTDGSAADAGTDS